MSYILVFISVPMLNFSVLGNLIKIVSYTQYIFLFFLLLLIDYLFPFFFSLYIHEYRTCKASPILFGFFFSRQCYLKHKQTYTKIVVSINKKTIMVVEVGERIEVTIEIVIATTNPKSSGFLI